MKPLTPASPHAIIMIGIPGAGKSTFGQRFATTFKALFVSQTTLQREYHLTDDEATALRDTILNEYHKTQLTLVIDGGLNKKEVRETMIRRLVKEGYRPLLIWVQTDTSEAHRRAVKLYPAGSGLTDEQFDEQLDQFDAPTDKDKVVVISGRHTFESQLKIVLKQLAIADHSQPRVPMSREEKERTTKINAHNRSRNQGMFLK